MADPDARVVAVAVPIPGLDLLTYRVPDDLDIPAVGARVLVPLGTRVVTGCVTGPAEPERSRGPSGPHEEAPLLTHSTAATSGPESTVLRDLIDVLDHSAFLPSDVVSLALWVSEYYMCGPGEAIAAAMPPRAWIESERQVRITDSGMTMLDSEDRERGLRLEVLRALEGAGALSLPTVATAVARARTAATIANAGAVARKKPADSPAPPGLHAVVASLARDGFVSVAQPLRGSRAAFKTVRVAMLTMHGHSAAESGSDGASPLQLGKFGRETIEILTQIPEGVPLPALAARGIPASSVTRLATRGFVTIGRRRVDRDPFTIAGADASAASASGAEAALTLTSEQTDALARLETMAATAKFRAAVLRGVTGSGKTELYLRLARSVERSGRSVLVLVPEIALTPAVAAAFRRVFGETVAIQHSGLSDGERYDQWHRIREGRVRVVVGTRSAVFAPLASLGLIVVDEEHDASYKQEESPRYHGRDVAVMRAKRAGALVVLGSATPSLESFQNALADRYELVTLERRVLDRPLATVRTVDMREEYAANGPDVILSEPLRTALGERLTRTEQAVVLLNRRGYATAVFCRQCSATVECPNCSVTLTVHRAVRRARCHYCNYSMALPKACVLCAGPYLEQIGVGTQRVEAEIRALFPAARVARLDRDSARRRGAVGAVLGRFARRELDVLVGTQMIAKGHDFPGVTLVGVISADVGLGLADFRAAERTFQLLTQVAGRAGRGDIAGEAIIQTLYPKHYSVRHACRQDYVSFYREEIQFRQAMRYPPVVGLVNVLVRAKTATAAMDTATDVAARLRAQPAGFRVLGPAPAPLERLRGEHRAQLFLKGTSRAAMRQALNDLLSAQPELRRKVAIDVDPLSVL